MNVQIERMYRTDTDIVFVLNSTQVRETSIPNKQFCLSSNPGAKLIELNIKIDLVDHDVPNQMILRYPHRGRVATSVNLLRNVVYTDMLFVHLHRLDEGTRRRHVMRASGNKREVGKGGDSANICLALRIIAIPRSKHEWITQKRTNE